MVHPFFMVPRMCGVKIVFNESCGLRVAFFFSVLPMVIDRLRPSSSSAPWCSVRIRHCTNLRLP